MDKEDLDELAEKHDKKWDEVMEVAKANGFIVQAFGGTATLITNKKKIEHYVYEKYQEIKKTNSSLEDIHQEEI